MKYAWSEDTFFILFLNKNDLLSDKIGSSRLHDYFPEFCGREGDDHAAREFIRTLFLQQLPKDKADKVYSFYTCATGKSDLPVDQAKYSHGRFFAGFSRIYRLTRIDIIQIRTIAIVLIL